MSAIPTYIYWAAFCAFAFVLWPFLAKSSGTPGVWISVLVLVGSLVACVLMGGKELYTSEMFTAKAFWIMMAAGALNGLALYFYGHKVTDPTIVTWMFVASVTIMMAVFAPLLSWLIMSEVITRQQWIGILLACSGIALINMKQQVI